MFFVKLSFAINDIYLYNDQALIKKMIVFNKIVPDFMDTIYIYILYTYTHTLVILLLR